MHATPLLGLACTAILLMGGCAAKTQPPADRTSPAPSTSTPATSTPPTPTTARPPAVRTITITVRGKKVTPAPSRVSIKPGQTLRLVVTTARDDRLHAHGFGLERPLLAGQPTTVDLVGAEPGQYEIETHDPALLLLLVQVR